MAKKVAVKKNPDCDPVTKGYVKCLMRKTYNHRHESYSRFPIVVAAAAVGFLALFPGVPSEWVPSFVVGAIVCTVVAVDSLLCDRETTYPRDGRFELLQEYKEPEVCKKKDVCEE